MKSHSNFKGDVLRLASGAGVAQAIVLLASPVLTRLYAPETFGVAAIFASVVSIMGVIACLRYEFAIVLPEDDAEGANLLAASLLISVATTLVVAWLVFGFGEALANIAGMPALVPFLWMLPVAIFVHGCFQALSFWNIRNRSFTHLSAARIGASFTSNSGMIVAGLSGHATSGTMIAANIAGQFMATAFLALRMFRDYGSDLKKHFSWETLTRLAGRYRKFPMFSTWAALMSAASWSLPVFLLAGFFSSSTAGLYVLGLRVLQAPMSLIGSAIAQVFHQRAAEAHRENRLGSLVGSLSTWLVVVTLCPIMILGVSGTDLFTVVFGIEWAQAGLYVQILSAWAFVWFITSPLSNIVGVVDKQEQGLQWQVAVFTSRLVALVIGGYAGSALLTIALLSFSGVIVYGYIVLRIFRMSECQLDFSMKRVLLKTLLVNAAITIVLIVTKLAASDPVVVIVTGGVILGAYYYVMRKEVLAVI